MALGAIGINGALGKAPERSGGFSAGSEAAKAVFSRFAAISHVL